MKKIILELLITLFSSSIFASDEKPGRFFEDQPDVTDDYQIHFIYMLTASDKDRELDINGKIEEYANKLNALVEKFSKKTKGSSGVKKFNGEFLVRNGEYQIFDGETKFPRIIVLKFPSYERALEWYNSEEYKPIKQIRLDNSEGTNIIIRGL